MQVAEEYRNNNEELARAGRIIAQMAEYKAFSYDSWDNEERDKNLDSVISELYERLSKNEDYQIDNKIATWFYDNVVMLNYEPFDNTDKETLQTALNKEYAKMRKSGVQGIGATDNADAGDLLNKSGSFYLYCYMNNDTAKRATKNIQWKRNKQAETYNYTNKVYKPLYGTQSAVDSVLYAGFLSKYNNNPQTVINAFMKTGGNDTMQVSGAAITLTAAMVVKIIIACIGFLGTVIAAILKFCSAKVSAKYAVPENATLGIADGDDIYEQEDSDLSDITKTIKDNAPIIAIAVVGLILYKMNNEK